MGTDDARSKILERRKRLIALALLGSASTTATACACLSPIPDAGRDAGAATDTLQEEDTDE